MNETHKVIKILAICFAIVIIANIFGAIITGISLFTNIDFNNSETKKDFIEDYNNITNIEIDVDASSITIINGDNFRVEATNISDNFVSKTDNNTLKIKETKQNFLEDTSNSKIIVYIPENSNLNDIEIDSGAGATTISQISAQKLDIDLGAGTLNINNSNFKNTNIDGGAGTIKISGSTLNNLDLNAGVGKVEITSDITGISEIECGVGEVTLNLPTNKDNYTISFEKGLGKLKIDNEEHAGNTYGRGTNKITLEGGIGNININFEN